MKSGDNMSEKEGKIKPPFKLTEKGTGTIDWEELTRMYLDQKMTAKDFLNQFRDIDVTKKKATMFLKRWEIEKNRNDIKSYDIRRNVKKLADNEQVDEETIKKRLSFLISRQNLQEWEATEAIKHSIMQKVNSENTTIHELGIMSKSLEVIFRLQRIALNMPVNGEGDAKIAIAAESTIKEQNQKNKEDIPTFVVEMNDNGKFKRLRPRKK